MLALYQPDIPQNCAALIRLCAAWRVPLGIIEPCGFVLDHKRLGRAELDYRQHADVTRFSSWEIFQNQLGTRRIVLLSTKAAVRYDSFVYQADDVLLIGQESSGVPEAVHNTADARVIIPMAPTIRSLNAAMSASLVLAEQMRQCDWVNLNTVIPGSEVQPNVRPGIQGK